MDIANPVSSRELTALSRLSVLRTHGHHLAGPILSPEICSQLASDVQAAIERGSARTGALLQTSDVLLEVLENADLGSLIDGVIGDDALLSIVQGLAGREAEWQHDFAHIRRSTSPRSLRCGVIAAISLQSADGLAEVLRGSQNLAEDSNVETATFVQANIDVQPGCVLLLEGGVRYRLHQGLWLKMQFIRPWIKPHILYSAALERNRLTGFGRRGRRWCGLDVGLPVSVEEFLAIEEAALEGTVGRAKGSGI